MIEQEEKTKQHLSEKLTKEEILSLVSEKEEIEQLERKLHVYYYRNKTNNSFKLKFFLNEPLF
jgi:hypothetical protein